MKRKLIAALACRNQGTRLYGKPVQNLDIDNGVRIVDNIINCLRSLNCIEEVVLGISEGSENDIFRTIAQDHGLKFIVGDQIDVLNRLIQCGELVSATDIFRVTSESPFLYFDPVEELWENHQEKGLDATFYDDIIDGCGFEIISLEALRNSHSYGSERHRSELCSLYLRENKGDFRIETYFPPKKLIRRDLRLTVDNPEDLIVCREIYKVFKKDAPRINVDKIVDYLDNRPELKKLIAHFTDEGYSSMYQ